MRLPDLHREVLDPHLQRGHPVHRLHKVSPLPQQLRAVPGLQSTLCISQGNSRGIFQLGCSSQTLPSRGILGKPGMGRGLPPMMLWKSLGPRNPSWLAGAVEMFALQFNPESQAETPEAALAACLPPAPGASASQRDGHHNTAHPAKTDRIGLS